MLLCSQAEARLGETYSRSLHPRRMAQSKSSVAYTTTSYQIEDSTITEYINSSNQVFAITWVGTFHPELDKILGTNYLNIYENNRSKVKHQGKRNSINLNNSGLVVKKFGHMGHLRGKAYDPNLVPNGVNINDLQ
jgi:hypothetical protein